MAFWEVRSQWMAELTDVPAIHDPNPQGINVLHRLYGPCNFIFETAHTTSHSSDTTGLHPMLPPIPYNAPIDDFTDAELVEILDRAFGEGEPGVWEGSNSDGRRVRRKRKGQGIIRLLNKAFN